MKPTNTAQHHLSRVRPILPIDFPLYQRRTRRKEAPPLHLWNIDRRFVKPARASIRRLLCLCLCFFFHLGFCGGHLVQQWLILGIIPGTNMHPGNVFCGALWESSPTRAHIQRTWSEAAPCLHHPTPLRRIECRWNLLPPEQPRVVKLFLQWRRR